jgi:hypothetical protein
LIGRTEISKLLPQLLIEAVDRSIKAPARGLGERPRTAKAKAKAKARRSDLLATLNV